MTLIIVSLFALVILSGALLWYAISYKSYQKRQSYVDNFTSYMSVLNYYMEKAFDMIYKDRILVFSVEGTRPSSEEFNTYSKDFCKLVFRMLGPTLLKEFTFLFGNEETLIFLVTEYFNTKSENDEIRQASLDQIMEQDIDETI